MSSLCNLFPKKKKSKCEYLKNFHKKISKKKKKEKNNKTKNPIQFILSEIIDNPEIIQEKYAKKTSFSDFNSFEIENYNIQNTNILLENILKFYNSFNDDYLFCKCSCCSKMLFPYKLRKDFLSHENKEKNKLLLSEHKTTYNNYSFPMSYYEKTNKKFVNIHLESLEIEKILKEKI